MDIHGCRAKYKISLKKLREMEKDGVLNVEKTETPDFWLQTVADIRKGRMSARSVALVYRWPEKIEALMSLTPSDRKVIEDHFRLVSLPSNDPPLSNMAGPTYGAAAKYPPLLKIFIERVQTIIPERDVTYRYLAVRLLLTCENESEISSVSDSIIRAFSNAKGDPGMKGWWHPEPGPYRRNLTAYHRPRRYDL